MYAAVPIDRFMPSMVLLKLSASALRALKPAMAPAMPRPAMPAASGPIDASMEPNALAPSFPVSTSL